LHVSGKLACRMTSLTWNQYLDFSQPGECHYSSRSIEELLTLFKLG
jgi:hypothetical protein